MRRIAVSLSTLLALAATFLATGSPAFAMQVSPPAGGDPGTVPPVVHHSAGFPVWAVAAIVVAALVVAGVVGLAMFIRSSRRTTAAPAAAQM
jgi:hypothetical protein